MPTLTVADALAEFLARRGVREIFAISGASDLRILDAIHRHPDLEYICPHHEQAGVMASITLGRLSGRLGVMLVTAGPGATNTVTGIASAFLDSIPMLLVGGQEKSEFMDPGSDLRGKGVQGLDMVSVVKSLTKYAVCVRDAQEIRYHLERALYEAHEGRPGPVWVEIPQDVQTVRVDWDALRGFTPPVVAGPDYALAARALVAMVRASERPLLWAGHGIRLAGAADRFRRVFDRMGVPSLAAWNGIDLIEEEHPLYAGRAGTYGQRAGNFALQNCDLVVGLGTRFAIPQRGYVEAEFARAARRVVVEIDPAEIAKWQRPPELVVQGDVGRFLEALEAVLEGEGSLGDFSSWVARCQKWRRDYPPYGPEHRVPVPGRVNSYQFIDRLSDLLGPDDVIATDMGTSLTCTHATFRVKRGQRVVTSTGLGEMGFGLPAAIGACLGSGRRRTIFLGTEGSLMMNIQELQTVVHHRLPIKAFILNNNNYLTIEHTERALFGDRFSGCGPTSGVTFPDLGKVSTAYGLPHFRLHDPAGIDAFVAEVLATPGPVFAEVMMPEDQFLGPKSAVKTRPDGTLYSPPLEDLFPFLPRDELRGNMIVPLLPE